MSKDNDDDEEEGNLMVFGQKVATPTTTADVVVPEENPHDDSMDDHSMRPRRRASFPSTAGAFDDDDAFATAAASVTYGPVFEDPTAGVREDDFAVGLERNLLLTTNTNHNSHADDDENDDDDESASMNMNMNLINTPRLWQQVLDAQEAAAQQQPEPLHELAIMAEENKTGEDLNLLGIAPMDLSARSHHARAVLHNNMATAASENSTQNQNVHAPNQTDDEKGLNHESDNSSVGEEEESLLQASFEENQLEEVSQDQAQQEETEPIPLGPSHHAHQPMEDYPPTQLLTDRKRRLSGNHNTDNNSLIMENHNDGTSTYRYRYERPMFTTPLKKRRFQDLVIPAPAPLPQPPPPQQEQVNQEQIMHNTTTTTTKTARQQVDQAMEARQIAKEKLEELEAQFLQLKATVETARETYQRTEQVAQTTLERLCDKLLLEDTSWNANYRLLRKYYRKAGHANVPRRWDRQPHENNASKAQQYGLTLSEVGKLGRWVGEQRRNYRQQQQQAREGSHRQSQDSTLLEHYQILALERLGFDWDPTHTAWQRQYQRLRRYAEEHGHTRVPCSTRRQPSMLKQNDDERTDNEGDSDNNNGTDDNRNDLRNLARWVKRQRYHYKLFQAGDSSSDMTPERIQQLNDLNFEWKLRGNTWMEFYQELKAFFLEHSNTLVPCGMKQLNEWTNEQRQQYRLYQENPSLSDLSPEQANLLSGLGLAEDLREGKWYRRFQEVQVFQQSHGHCIVPTKYPFNQQLVNWCATQRRQYKLLGQGKKSQLTPDRVQLLNGIGFQWAVSAKDRAESKLKDVWEERYAECLQHHNECGTMEGLAHGSPLHRWWREQRQHHWNFKSGKPSALSPEQIDQLERLGISRGDASLSDNEAISSSESCWEGLYGDLLMYRLNHGTFSIPDTGHYQTLHEFVKKQRREYLKFKRGVPSSLNEHRVRRLDKVGFPWKSTDGKEATIIQPTWEEMFGELLAFRLNFNSFDVSREYNQRLHDWIEDQKQLYRCFGNQSINFESNDTMSTSLLRKRYEKLEDISFPWD